MTEHVLIVGIDGVRWDVLREEPTPHLDALAARGFLAPVWANEAAPTISGPSWATILTGALADRHLIRNNDLSPNGLADHPDVLRLAATQRPEICRYAAAGWGPLVRNDSGGPLLADGGYFPPGRQAHLPGQWRSADQAVTDATVSHVTEHDGTGGSLVFCYLGGVDEVGHLLGVGKRYRQFVRDSDTRLGELLTAVEQRPSGERWTIIVATDHGHVDRGGHGGDTVEERTAWIAAAGTDVPTTAPDHLEQADVTGHAMHLLGLDPPSGTVGLAFGTRT